MILKKERIKKVKGTRTYRFRITNLDDVDVKFPHVQEVQAHYFNYALKYMYQHYGVKHLDVRLPTGDQKKYFILKLVKFARKQAAKHKGFDLKKMDYSVQSIDKMLEGLYVNFDRYRKGQYKRIHYWSEKDTQKYLATHKCGLSGYGRISYKHSYDDVHSVTFKQNHDRIALMNNYCLKVPYFGKIKSEESLTAFKHKKIVEAKIIKRREHDYELQVVTKFEEQRQITKEMVKQAVGLDVNLKDNHFFVLSNKQIVSWGKDVEAYYRKADAKSRKLQRYLTKHNKGRDNSKTTRRVKQQLSRLQTKTAYKIDAWQLKTTISFATKYPVLAMEELHSFDIRVSKRAKNYKMRKNINHKLAMLQPSTFRKQMEYIYQDRHGLLLEVNTIDTSKTCNKCGFINHDLKFEKQWTCPHCHQKLDRDINAAYNIRDWAVTPKKHAALQQPDRFPYLNEKNIVTTF